MSDETRGPSTDSGSSWFERPENIKHMLYALYGACGLVFVLDILIPKHSKFAIEHVFGFYAVYGAIGALVLVFAAQQLRKLVMRDEDYYDE